MVSPGVMVRARSRICRTDQLADERPRRQAAEDQHDNERNRLKRAPHLDRQYSSEPAGSGSPDGGGR